MTKRAAQMELADRLRMFALSAPLATAADIEREEKWLASHEFLEICNSAEADPDAVRCEFDRLFKAAIGDAFAMAI